MKNCGTTINKASCQKCVRFVMYEMNSKETDLFKNVEHMKTRNNSTKMTNVTTLISYQILKYIFLEFKHIVL